MRQKIVNDFISCFDSAAGKTTGLDPKTKRATVSNMVNLPEDAKKRMPEGNQFEEIRLTPRPSPSGSRSNTTKRELSITRKITDSFLTWDRLLACRIAADRLEANSVRHDIC